MSATVTPGHSAGLAEKKRYEYRAGWLELEARKRQERLERHSRADKAAREAAQVLRQRFGAWRVRAFGSILYPEQFHSHSDIDLAAEGIEPAQLLKAWCAVSALAPEFDFDLLILDECRQEVKQAVEEEGVEL